MRAVIRHRYDGLAVDVWITRHTSAGPELYVGTRDDDFAPSWQPVEYGVEPAPSFSLPDDVFAALIDAGNQLAHGPAIADSIADARKTRDRLLTLIERITV